MPIYEYKCSACGHRFDVLQRMGEDGAHLSCPLCGAAAPEKMLSACATAGRDSSVASAGSCGSGFS